MNIDFSAPVTHGYKIAQPFGIATANLDLTGQDIKLKEGVYFVLANQLPALLHFGQRKTFGSDFSAEVHILDFEENLYGKNLEVKVLKKLREIQKFQNADALYTQIEQDILHARKYFLRQEIKALWQEVSEEERQNMAQAAAEKIMQNKHYKSASCVLAYQAMKDELPFVDFLEKKFIYPENITEKPDFIIVPGLAASIDGKRLGRGGGFYDQLLAKYPDVPTLIVIPKMALREDIPTEPHDVLIDEVITVSCISQPL